MDCIGIEGQLELFNGSPVVVYTCEPDGDFATTFVSPSVTAQLGWEPSDFLTDPTFWTSHIHPDDKGLAIGGIYNLFDNDHYSREYRFQHKDGSYRWMSDNLQLERDDSGEPVRIVGYWMDVSAQKQAKQALSDSETRYRQLAELSPDGMFVHVDGKIVYANAKLAQILAIPSPANLYGVDAIEMIAPEYRDRIKRRRDDVMKGGITNLEQSDFLRSDGSRVPVERSGGLITWEGSPAILVLIRDVSKREAASRALRESEELFRGVVEHLPVAFTLKDLEGRYQFVNTKFAAWYDGDQKELIGKTPFDAHPETFANTALAEDREVTETGHTLEIVDEAPFADGTMHTVAITKFPVFGADGKPISIAAIGMDITEQTRARNALVENRDQLRLITDNLPVWITYIDDQQTYRFVSKTCTEWLVRPAEEIVGKTISEVMGQEYEKIGHRIEKTLAGERQSYVNHVTYPDGATRTIQVTNIPHWGPAGNVVGFFSLVDDISEREAAAQALRESRDQLRLVTDNLPALIVYIDAQRIYRFVNKTCAEWHARPSEEIIGKSVSELVGKEYAKFEPRITQVLNGELQTFVDTVAYPDGATRTVRATFIPHRGASGNVEGYFSLVEDFSELQQAEEALRHALKMEAVGQLTGGVAHDFNNLLAVILGNVELLHEKIGGDPLITQIDHAATRGAELTQRLLAFSRQQELQPQLVDLTELVPNLHELFGRTLGETVKISMAVPGGVWPVTADPGQLENALLNLAINARDAMPEGGTLEIECSNIDIKENDARFGDEVAAGDYVQIAVRDSGSGMAEDVLEHAFEPFYTTKDVGEGSGLGLSMVYGFARQSGGDATIESEPGTGTEIRLFLPRSEVTTMSDEPLSGKDRKRGQGEVILVLEDDPDVRSFAVAALEGLGYRVHQAADAVAAMQVLEDEAEKLDLLLSDVVLPGGVSGPELAAKARDLYPKLKLVFMSGYAADLYTDDKIPGFDETLLTKPFRLAELSKAIHDTLAA